MNYISLVIVICLVLLSGLFSGLTLGLMSLDKTELERKIKAGNKKAKKIYPVRKNGNLLLCTLLLGNVLVNSTLAIFMNSMAVGVIAVISSTSLIVVFGEIIPQAVISRHALNVGSKTVWIVKIFRFLLFPFCWPLAYVLDKALGEEMPTIWERRELEEVIKTHSDSPDSEIDSDEERIILGALNFSNKEVKAILTPRIVVFMLEADDLLDKKMLEKIKRKGFTRIPVYKEEIDNIIGVLYIKDLIGISLGKKAKDICKKKKVMEVYDTDKLDDILNLFITKRVHLAIVYDEYKEYRGIVTLEDIVEEVLKKEIVDEHDSIVDLQKLAKEKAKKKK